MAKTFNKLKHRHERFLTQVHDEKYYSKYGPKLKIEPNTIVTFSNIKSILVSHGYICQEEFELNKHDWEYSERFESYRISGNGIRGFCFSGAADYWEDLILIDNSKCYNKAQQCPVRLSFPILASELFKILKQTGSPAGFEICNGNFGPRFDEKYSNPFK